MVEEVAYQGTQILYCIGCGNAVATYKPKQILAIACRCGAMAPFLSVGRDPKNIPGLPASLVLNNLPGHWEYYLGYSDHMSEVKARILDELEKMGLTAQTQCMKEECVRAVWRYKQREGGHD